MDYLKIPRSLIYKERNDLKDFGVQTPDTMNSLLFLHLKQQALMGVPGAREVALRCYNNAYYICTLILLEADNFPELRVSDYVDTILETEKENKYTDEVCLASMAMACLLLAKYDEKRYGTDSEIWKKIYYRCTHYQWYHSSEATIFLNMMSWEYSCTSPLSKTEFEPRNIIDVIENFSERDFQDYSEYICKRLAHLKDPRQRIYWTDMAVAQIKGYQLELCEDTGYDPKKDCFKHTDNYDPIRDLSWENKVRACYQRSKEAIKYYTEHYPTKEENDSVEKTVESTKAPETEAPQTKFAELESKLTQQETQLKETNNINTQQATRIKELEAELENELKEHQQCEKHTKDNSKLLKRIAELEQEVNRLNTNLSTKSNVDFEELNRRTETLQSLYDAAEKRLKRYESIFGTEEKLSKEKKFNIAERVIFCSSLLGCSLNEGDIIQQQMAKMIMRFSGDKWPSIRTTISDMNGKRTALEEVAKKVKQEEDAGARMALWRREEKNFQGITNAALNVYKYLHSAVRGATVGAKAYQCKQAMENIDHAYYLTERKLIIPTDGQPQGDDFILPPEEI